MNTQMKVTLNCRDDVWNQSGTHDVRSLYFGLVEEVVDNFEVC